VVSVVALIPRGRLVVSLVFLETYFHCAEVFAEIELGVLVLFLSTEQGTDQPSGDGIGDFASDRIVVFCIQDVLGRSGRERDRRSVEDFDDPVDNLGADSEDLFPHSGDIGIRAKPGLLFWSEGGEIVVRRASPGGMDDGGRRSRRWG